VQFAALYLHPRWRISSNLKLYSQEDQHNPLVSSEIAPTENTDQPLMKDWTVLNRWMAKYVSAGNSSYSHHNFTMSLQLTITRQFLPDIIGLVSTLCSLASMCFLLPSLSLLVRKLKPRSSPMRDPNRSLRARMQFTTASI
jgi:hypothetical protein